MLIINQQRLMAETRIVLSLSDPATLPRESSSSTSLPNQGQFSACRPEYVRAPLSFPSFVVVMFRAHLLSIGSSLSRLLVLDQPVVVPSVCKHERRERNFTRQGDFNPTAEIRIPKPAESRRGGASDANLPSPVFLIT